MAGARSKYESHVKPYLSEINKKIREGVTEEAIAKSLKISVASLNNYRNKYPEFAEALSKSKGADVLDSLINAGVKSACGFFETEETTTYVYDPEGNEYVKQKVANKKYYPPNGMLNKFYAMNFGKEMGLVDNPQEYELRKQKQESEAKDNWLK